MHTRSEQILAHAIALHEAGNTRQAEELYRLVLEEEPGNPDALHLLGVVAQQEGCFDASAALISEAIRLNPEAPHYHNNLGNTFRYWGKLNVAERYYLEALRLATDYVDALSNLGVTQREMGRADDAIASFRTALRIQPNRVEVLFNLGNALLDAGKTDEAIASHEDALKLRPDLAAALYRLANALEESGGLETAVRYYRAVLAAMADRVESEPELKPALASAHKSLGNLLKGQGKMEEARSHYAEAFHLHPTDGVRLCLATMVSPFYESTAHLQQSREALEHNVAKLEAEQLALTDPLKEVGTTEFFLAYQGFNDRDIQARIGQLYRRAYRPEPIDMGCRSREGKIRIGFISSFFSNHTIGKLNRGLIANLSRERFEVCVFSLGPHDDELAGRIRQDAEHFIQLPARDLAAMRERIAAENLDILFYTDIGMDPATYFLAYSRLAPVQCVTWGHPDTTGIDTIDYFISSELLETGQSEESYTESLVRLKSLPTYYYRPSLPSVFKPRAHFGLDEESHIYLCPQSLFKFHPDFDAALGGILRQDPVGRVVIIEGKFRNWTELLQGRFQTTLPDVAERIVFLPSQNQLDFFSLIAVADVMLDPFHFGGGNSTYEGLALGMPIVSLPGEFMRGRVTGACYRKMGLTDCIAADAGEYVEIALRLGTDKAYREQIKRRILASNFVLYEDLDAVRELEQFFLHAVDVAKSA